MKLALLNYAYESNVRDPDELLDRYATLTGWSHAVAEAGVTVHVVQRFSRAGSVTRGPVRYVFCRDAGDGNPGTSWWPRAVHDTVMNLRPDLVHVNGLDSPIQTWLLRRALPLAVPILVQDHASGLPESSGAWRAVRRAVRTRAMRAADAFFFTAEEQAEAWRHAGFIGKSQATFALLEASTNLRPLETMAARETTGLAGRPAILWVGRLNANKDPLTVLDGFEQSLVRMPNAVLSFVFSEADLLPAVDERLRQSPNLARHVRLLGRVPHHRLAELYSAADIFVLGSHHEGSGYALIEACACGALPVVTDIPTFRVITGNGTIGALWTAGSAARLATALVHVSSLDRRASRLDVRDHFDRTLSWSIVAKQAVDAYAEVQQGR